MPGVNFQISDRLASPNVQEFTLGLSRRLGARGLVRVDGVFRSYGDFYTLHRDLSTGKVQDQFGRSFDLGIYENVNEPLERTYRGVNFQVSYRPSAVREPRRQLHALEDGRQLRRRDGQRTAPAPRSSPATRSTSTTAFSSRTATS